MKKTSSAGSGSVVPAVLLGVLLVIFEAFLAAYMFVHGFYDAVGEMPMEALSELPDFLFASWYPLAVCGSSNISDCNARDPISGLGRSPGEGNGYSFQYPCLENPMDRGAWQVTVHGVAQSQT